MVSLFGRGFESHQLHHNKSKSHVVRLNYRTFAFYYIMYQYIFTTRHTKTTTAQLSSSCAVVVCLT